MDSTGSSAAQKALGKHQFHPVHTFAMGSAIKLHIDRQLMNRIVFLKLNISNSDQQNVVPATSTTRSITHDRHVPSPAAVLKQIDFEASHIIAKLWITSHDACNEVRTLGYHR